MIISVFMGDAQIMNAKEGAQPVPVSFKDGDVRFTGPLVHAVTDTGSNPPQCNHRAAATYDQSESMHGIVLYSSAL